LLLKNYRLSDDLAFRFSDRKWNEWPLTADKFNTWVEDSVRYAPLLNLFMDYETFGEHQWAESGIFGFFEKFVDKWLSADGNTFYTVSEALDANAPYAVACNVGGRRAGFDGLEWKQLTERSFAICL